MSSVGIVTFGLIGETYTEFETNIDAHLDDITELDAELGDIIQLEAILDDS